METYEVLKKLPVFTTILDDHQSLNEKLIRVIDDHQKLNAEGLKRGTNVDAWRTDFYTRKDTNDFDFLIDKIIPVIYNVNQDYFNDQHTFYDCQNFWAMKYSEGDCAYKHNHYPVDFSCVYYINVTEKSSPIVFENKLKVQPKDGMLVLFPGIINHNVFPTKDKRIAFAANFVKIQT